MAAAHEATETCARTLARWLPEGLAVITSPLQRCEQLTTALCALRPDLTPKTDKNLQEMNFGAWEGRPWDSIARTELDAWTANFADYPVGGSGESVSQFMARVASAYDSLDLAGNTLWVTHAGVIRAATLLAQGLRQIVLASQWPLAAPGYGQWCKLRA